MIRRLVKRFLPGLLGALVIAVGISVFTTTTATFRFYYSVTPLGSGHSIPNAINDIGQIVGVDYPKNNNGFGNAFVWENGTMRNIGNLGGRFSEAYDINNQGQVVGISETSSKSVHSFLWQAQNDTLNDLGLLGGGDKSFLWSINNNGQIAGESRTLANGSYNFREAVLRLNGRVVNLGTLGGELSAAFGINNRRQIVGESSIASGQTHAFLWQNRQMIDLGTLGGEFSSAKTINNLGQVAGRSTILKPNPGTSYHCFLWSNQAMTDLTPNSPHDCYANSINNRGTVVGNFAYSVLMNQRFYPFVWRDRTITNLNSLLPPNSGWKLETANDINNNGQIVGTGRFNREIRGVLLTPITIAQ